MVDGSTPAGRSPGRASHLPARLNLTIAERFEEAAELLEEQAANPFRVRAWRQAAGELRDLEEPVDALLARAGTAGLVALPGIGETLARAVRDLVQTGRLPILERLRGEVDPEALLRTVPGIGRGLARRIHDELAIGSLEELEVAAHDGRLAVLPGFGAKRLAGIRDALAVRLQRSRGRALPEDRGAPPIRFPPPAMPTTAELLDVDREYRDRAGRGELRTIAPRRFNPRHEAWLPILHTTRGRRHYTALYSNTARAHQLGRTHDWVVLYCDGELGELRFTVVTARTGPLDGRRVVRGRESECRRFYASSEGGAAARRGRVALERRTGFAPG